MIAQNTLFSSMILTTHGHKKYVPQLGYCSSYGAITWLHRAPHVILHQVVQFSSSYIKKG